MARLVNAKWILVLAAVSERNALCVETPPLIAWTSQFGASLDDHGYDVSAVSSGVYVGGATAGNLAGSNTGGMDGFIRKFDANGGVMWTRQLGTSSADVIYGISADSAGNVYASGYTGGKLGRTDLGLQDAFITKYGNDGTTLWIRQFGTNLRDESHCITTDSLGRVYVGGTTGGDLGSQNAGSTDAFVVRCDASGNLVWARQLGTSADDGVLDVSGDDSGNVYACGYTGGPLAGSYAGHRDAFVCKFNALGDLVWSRQYGTISQDSATALITDGQGNIYVTGLTGGDLGGQYLGGLSDAYISKYDADGALLWTRQFGSSAFEVSTAITHDGAGGIYISGYTEGGLGVPNEGLKDSFVAKYDLAGDLLWTGQLGTSGNDYCLGLSSDGVGVYATGYSEGNLGGPNTGGSDIFVVKFEPIPEPSSFVTACLLISGFMAVMGLRRWRTR